MSTLIVKFLTMWLKLLIAACLVWVILYSPISSDTLLIISILTVIPATFFYFWLKKRRIAFIKSFKFPASIEQNLKKKYPHFTTAQIDLVLDTLRSFLLISYKAKRRPVAMPSLVVDEAWHEFILFTKPYEIFCKKGIGRFLHHTPTEAMQSRSSAQDSIKRAWRLACHLEGINQKNPKRLPMLFAIDGQLKIKGGFTYLRNCRTKKASKKSYCACDINCASGCSGSTGNCSSSSSSSYSKMSCSSDSSSSSSCSGGD